MAAGPSGAQQPRLNPFAFPSDTTFRFFLLVVSIVGVSLFLYNWLYFEVSDNQAEVRRTLACVEEQQAALAVAATSDDLDAAASRFAECLDEINRPKAAFMLGGVAVLLAAALAFFFAAPLVKRRRRRLEPFREDDAPDVAAELRGLVEEAGLERAPQFVWNPLNPSPGGLAFGRPGRYHVALSGGLVTTFYTDRPAFRAVVLHELAHLRNRDVAKTYFTVSIWWAFVLVGVLPFLVSLVDEDANTVFDLGWRLVALTVFVYLTRNAVLRAREVYADVRASTSEGVTPALTKLLGAMRPPARPWLNRLVGLHPSPAVRLHALEDPRGLISLGTLEAFGAGIAATIAFAEVVTLVDFFAVESLSTMWISALVFAPLAVGVVGLGAWRSAFGALALGERPGGSWRIGLALGLGFLVGQHFSLVAALGADPTIISARPWSLDVLWSVVLLVGLGLFVAWITTSARVWLPVAAPSRSPAWASALGLVVAAGVLTVFMGIFFLVRQTRDVIEVSTSGTAELHDLVAQAIWAGPTWLFQFVMDPELLWFAERPPVWFALAAVWAFPLAAALFLRTGRPDLARWATLDGSGARLPPPVLRVGRAAAIGLAGAALAYVLPLVLRAGIHAGVAEATRDQDDFLLGYAYWSVVLALACQAVVAAVTVAVTSDAAVVHGLFAAMLTGLGGVAGIITHPTIGSCVDVVSLRQSPCEWAADGSFVKLTLEQVLVQGFLVGLVGAGVTLAVKPWLAGAVKRLVTGDCRERRHMPT
jgi:Zn-dependent protease with chaperone function